jgi:Icc-related predicted phosphoesterase
VRGAAAIRGRGLARRKQRGPRTRIVFATDLHAGELTFRRFLNSASVYEADVLILGGDLTGKVLAPIIERDGSFEASVLGGREVVSRDGVEQLEERFRNIGFYPVRVDPEEFARIRDDAVYRDELTDRLCREQVSDWLARAAERLAPAGIEMIVSGGNDDPLSIEPILDSVEHVRNGEGRVLTLAGGYEIISTGYGNITPWSCPRDITEAELAERIDAIAGEVENMDRCIFNLHVPPFDSSLDIAPRLDTSVVPPSVIPGQMAPVGSTAVREAIERYQPLLALHGHIHESRAIATIGRTVCINPGSEYGEGILRAAIIDLADGRIASRQLVAG